MREAERRKRLAATTPLRRAEGAVSAEENRPEESASPMYSRAQQLQQEADQFLQQMREQLPADLGNSVDTLNDKTTSDPEKVEEIVPQESPAMQDAYAEEATTRRRISFDRDSLRTFFVTREVLGPPRSRKPHLPGVKNK